MSKIDKRKLIKKNVEKEVLVDQYGIEDTKTAKGFLINRPLTSIGMAIFFLGPIIGAMTENNGIGGILFLCGAALAAYGESKKL